MPVQQVKVIMLLASLKCTPAVGIKAAVFIIIIRQHSHSNFSYIMEKQSYVLLDYKYTPYNFIKKNMNLTLALCNFCWLYFPGSTKHSYVRLLT